jgi:hypothetical protein
MPSNPQTPCSSHTDVHDNVITSRPCVHCKRHAVCFCCSPPHCQFHTTSTCDHYGVLYAPGHRSHGRSPPSNRSEFCWCCTCRATCLTCTKQHCHFHKGQTCGMRTNSPVIWIQNQKIKWKGIKIIDEYEFNEIELKIHTNIKQS